MSDDMVKRLREATFSKSTIRGGIIGQTIEAAMRSTFHEVSAYDLHEAAEIIEALTAERDALRAQIERDALIKMPPDCAPKGVPVLVAGGIAMRKTGGEWFSGMCDPAFSRALNWQPKWWAPIPQQNDPIQQEGAKG
jgi:hypothetical protein